MSGIMERYSGLSRRDRFFAIIGMIVLLSVLFSLVARVSIFRQDDSKAYRVGLVVPKDPALARVAESLTAGAQLYIDSVNAAGGLNGQPLQLAVESSDSSQTALSRAAKALVEDERVVALVGPLGTTSMEGIAVVNPSAPLEAERNQAFSLTPTLLQQTRFLANYSLNVLGKRVVSIVAMGDSDGALKADTFSATYESFKTKTNYRWDINPAQDLDSQLDAIVTEVRERVDTGALFLALAPEVAAEFVKKMRDQGGRNAVLGLSGLASDAFRKNLAELVKTAPGSSPSYRTVGDYLDGITLTSPLMFDTANEQIQDFKNGYIDATATAPDWLSAHAFSAVKLATDGLVGYNGTDARKAVLNYLRELPLSSENSATSPSYFDGNKIARKSNFIGVYSGETLVSAPTQLQPIIDGGNKNYIAEFRAGRVLFVNDRFMYKTNVVYTGIQVDEISNIDLELQTADIDFSLWFRFKGDFQPQDLNFANSVEPILLGEPELEKQQGDMTYRLYRVKSRFYMNFQQKAPPYGQHLIGLSFSHNQLNKDNLQYVVDLLGLGLASGKTFESVLNESRAVNPALGWNIDRAWISQDIKNRNILGNPNYVGNGGSRPDFSTIETGIILKKNEFAIKNFVSAEYFAYFAIFGFLGAVFAIGMDGRKKGGFWNFHSWMLRLVSWPVLLLAAGNLALDFSAQNLSAYYTDILATLYACLWWIMPARLTGLAVERFVWQPLERHTGRMIPNVIRAFGAIVIYAFAGLGIVAFVMGETLTSLLATSGVLAMIVGLAIQANIANVFSGIILNIERPFQVGDFINVDGVFGRVKDITWRTVRIESLEGPVVSLTNAKVSESKVENHNDVPKGLRVELPFYLPADSEPEHVERIINEIIDEADYVLGKGTGKPAHQLIFGGMENVNGNWVGSYLLIFKVKNFLAKIQARGEFHQALRSSLKEHEIALVPSPDSVFKSISSSSPG